MLKRLQSHLQPTTLARNKDSKPGESPAVLDYLDLYLLQFQSRKMSTARGALQG